MRTVFVHTHTRGFTLIEMLVVVMLISILGFSAYSFFIQSYENAQIAEAQQELELIRKAAVLLHADTGYYPMGPLGTTNICGGSGDNEVRADAPQAGLLSNGNSWSGWKGPYIDGADLIDPWGTAYWFDADFQCQPSVVGCQGRADSGPDSAVIVSCGPDRALPSSGGGCIYSGDEIVIFMCERR